VTKALHLLDLPAIITVSADKKSYRKKRETQTTPNTARQPAWIAASIATVISG
jgi:hypothetical protein